MVVLVILLVSGSAIKPACAMAPEMAQAFDDAEHQARQLLDSVPDPAWLVRDRKGVFVAVTRPTSGSAEIAPR